MTGLKFKLGFLFIFAGALSACGTPASSPPNEPGAVSEPHQSTSANTYKVMLTSFDPFGGSGENNSQPIVAELAKMADSLGPNLSIETCNLSVVYDLGAKEAADCFNKILPDVVVSFGEADCSIRIETAANNLDNTLGTADNAGNVRKNQRILASGPARSGFNFPVESMYCALPKDSGVDVSKSPGNFICNDVAYQMSQMLEPKNIPFTFIHVPNSKCTESEKNPETNAKMIASMLTSAFSSLRDNTPQSTWPNPLTNQTLLPTNKKAAKKLLASIKRKNAPSCEVNFMNELIAAYQDPGQD